MLVVDGNHLMHRCHHQQTKTPLLAPDGSSSGALFGFVRSLRMLRRDLGGRYGAVLFDRGGSAFRRELYPEYKNNRQAAPDDLKKQFKQAHRWAHMLGWHIFESEGVEADDMMAFLACNCKGAEVVLVTGDKDAEQLVCDAPEHVCYLWKPRFTGGYEKIDERAVKNRWGVGPKGVADILALMGDTSDNVPGVVGIGEKGAKALIAEYGSLEAAIEDAKLNGDGNARLCKLRDQEEQALLCKRLVHLGNGIAPPGWRDVLDCVLREPDWPALYDAAIDRGFNSMLEEIRKHLGAAGVAL
jgi:DNA polymerase-1